MFEQLLTSKSKPVTPDPGFEDAFLADVPGSAFVNTAQLLTLVGALAGTVLEADPGWLKFRYQSKILYVAKRCLLTSFTHAGLSGPGMVFGTKTIVIAGKTYKVRLLKGATSNPAAAVAQAAGGEWNDLLYSVYGGNFKNEAVIQARPRWAAYTDAELGVSPTGGGLGNGVLSMCQETCSDRGGQIGRGFGLSNKGLIDVWYIPAGVNPAYVGWRPVLEEV